MNYIPNKEPSILMIKFCSREGERERRREGEMEK